MPGLGKGKAQLNASTTQEKVDYIQARADALGWSNAKAVKTIVDFWLALGAPPLSEHDSAIKPAPIPTAAAVELPTWWKSYKGKGSKS
jgi:hypothetical protein